MNKLKIQSTAKAGPEKLAFTLVELIVVITILAILGTIAFISLQGYSANSRDSVRISDMGTIKTSLEIYKTDSGNYPLPTNLSEITYSGGIAWSQGYFGEQTIVNLNKLDKVPRDPLTDKEYVYSTTNTKNEYQLAGIFEGDNVSLNIEETIAAGQKTAILRIIGTYNGKVLQISTGTTDYILGVPSIISSTGITLLETIISSKQLAYDGYKNLPYQYDTSGYNTTGDSGLNLVNLPDLVVFSGDKNDLSKPDITGVEARKALVENLQKAYTDTTIKNVGEIEIILLATILDAKATELLATSILNNSLGGKIVPGSTPNSLVDSCNTGYGWNGSSCVLATQCNVGIENITIGTGSNIQTWSCKNVGATEVWDGTSTFTCTSPTDCSNKPDWAGGYYQWGRNDNTEWTNGQSIAPYLYGWEPQNDTKWGGNTGDTNVLDGLGTTAIGRQGPCPDNYHVPSAKDWKTACDTISLDGCASYGNGRVFMKTTLKLYYSGRRDGTTSNYSSQNSLGYYWVSSPSSPTNTFRSRSFNIHSAILGLNSEANRSEGYSIRCIKN